MTIYKTKNSNSVTMDSADTSDAVVNSSEPNSSELEPEASEIFPDDATDSTEHSFNSSNHMLSPDIFSDSSHPLNVSRYGRTRKQKTIADFVTGSDYSVRTIVKSPKSSAKKKTPDKKKTERSEPQSNSSRALCSTPNKSKVYVHKDLSQKLDKEETVNLMRSMFSPVKSSGASFGETPCSVKSERSMSPSVKIVLKKSPQGLFECSPTKIDNSQHFSDYDCEDYSLIKNEEDQICDQDDYMSDEQDCGWVEGDLAWARVGGHPLWPCLITRDTENDGKFVKKKIVGRSLVPQFVMHVTFFADNGRHSWLLNSFLLRFHGLDDFYERKSKITSEMRKRDPKYCAAFDVKSNKKTKWHSAVTEAEMLLRRPAEVREQFLITFKENAVQQPKKQRKKRTPKVQKNANDTLLSESLFDSLFNSNDEEDATSVQNENTVNAQIDEQTINNISSKISKHKPMSQTHMDKWLLKAKSEKYVLEKSAEIKPEPPIEDNAAPSLQSLEKEVIQPEGDDKLVNNNDILSNEIKIEEPNSEVPFSESVPQVNHESDSNSSTSIPLKRKRKRNVENLNDKRVLRHRKNEDVSDVDENNLNNSSSEDIVKDPKYENSDFQQFLAVKRDAFMDDNPDLGEADIMSYLYKVWEYGENQSLDEMKNINSMCLVKGMADDIASPPPKKVRKSHFDPEDCAESSSAMRERCARKKAVKSYVPDDLSTSDSESDYEAVLQKGLKEVNVDVKEEVNGVVAENEKDIPNETSPDLKLKDSQKQSISDRYMESLKLPKPSIFKGMSKEKVCEICESPANLIKCKGPCQGMFHLECVKKQALESDSTDQNIQKGRKMKRKSKNLNKSANSNDNETENSIMKHDSKLVVEPHLNGQVDIPPCSSAKKDSDSDDASNDDMKPQIIEIVQSAAEFESQLSQKMIELMEKNTTMDSLENCSLSSVEDCDWNSMQAGECVIVDAKVMKSRKKISTPEIIEPLETEVFKCNHCSKHSIPLCSVCKSITQPKTGNEYRKRCNVTHCHQFYHPECLKAWPQTKYTSLTSMAKGDSNNTIEAVTCPRHVCHTCVSDDPQGCKTRFSGDKLARCVKCPATYHCFTKCVPAGTRLITASQIICPRHTDTQSGKTPYHVNTAWCFICAKGGTLVCCETCPTSFHAECLNIPLPEGGYICEDCETGRLPLYEELVWVKLGQYRWWPALVLHPSDIPPNIYLLPHKPGQFAVRFFGIYDHYWISGGRVFPYQEGDTGHASSKKSSIDNAFMVAIKQAQQAFAVMKELKERNLDDNELSASLLPPKYVKLKVNRAIGGAIAFGKSGAKAGPSKCECDPNMERPCAPESDCLNRMLLTECSPNVCAAGQRCCNQAFEKRLYPPLEPSRTSSRGWGLKILADLKKGDFVIEYVGEVIDEAEFQRRMVRRQEMRDENYYFLTLDKDRMIDAGPKGNVARFMNHSCEPNCETQKWTVNGDTRVGLFALEDIPAGTEITFNYNLTCAGDDKKRCLCGTKRCAGFIGAKPKQEEVVPKKPRKMKRKYRKHGNNSLTASTSKTNLKPRKCSSEKEVEPELEPEGIDRDVAIINKALYEQEARNSATLTNGDISEDEQTSSNLESNSFTNSVDKINGNSKTVNETDDYPAHPIAKDNSAKTNNLIGKRKRLSLQLNHKTKNSPNVSNKRTRSNSVQFSDSVMVIDGNNEISFNQDTEKLKEVAATEQNGFTKEEYQNKEINLNKV